MDYSKSKIIVVSCFIFLSCNFLIENGGRGVSHSIEESKNNGAFISEYKPAKKSIVLNDTLSVNVQSAWIEKIWHYAGKENEKAEIRNDGFQMIVLVDNSFLKGLRNGEYTARTMEDSVFNQGYKNELIVEGSNLQSFDTIFCKVESGDNLTKPPHRQILGKFCLIKKK